MAQTVAIELRNSDRSRLALEAMRRGSRCKWQCHTKFFANYRALASGVRPGVAKARYDIYDQL